LFWLLRRGHPPRKVALIAAGLAGMAAALRWTWWAYWRPAGLKSYKILFTCTFTRADSLLIGIVVGALTMDPTVRAWLSDVGAVLRTDVRYGRLFIELAPWIATIGVVVFVRRETYFSSALYHLGFTVFALIAGVIVMHCMTVEDSVYVRVLSLRPLVAIGKISYGVYLYHLPISLIIVDHTHVRPLLRLLLVTAISIAVATLSYFAIERPARRLGRRPHPTRLTPAKAIA
jgi:peptidoglycan/LPS O-acetylase OafA/YrhL